MKHPYYSSKHPIAHCDKQTHGQARTESPQNALCLWPSTERSGRLLSHTAISRMTVACEREVFGFRQIYRLIAEYGPVATGKIIVFGSKIRGLGSNVLSLAQTVKPSSNLKPGLKKNELGLGA